MIKRKGCAVLYVLLAVIVFLLILLFTGGCEPTELQSGIVREKIYEEAETRLVLLPNDDPFYRGELKPEIVRDDEDYKLRIEYYVIGKDGADKAIRGRTVKVTKDYYDLVDVGEYIEVKDLRKYILKDDGI